MGSFDISYDAEDDALEVTFELYNENFVRTLALNDNIILFTDLGLHAIWGISFYSYSRLLQVSETEFTSLKDLPPDQAQSILAMLTRKPASHFFDITDPLAFIARIGAPNLHRLVEENED